MTRADSSLVGHTLHHYRIVGTLGEGGMGRIYRAIDTRLEREVALKVLTSDASQDDESRRRLLDEAKAASTLTHPHIVTVYDVDRVDSPNGPIDFIAMEYLQGGSLSSRIGPGLSVDDTLRYGLEVADALATAHAAGIVHRDIKPANVMLASTGAAKVVDFGLAKRLSGPNDQTGGRSFQTEAGTVLGTISYMAPEQAEGKAVDARADVFAFGAMVYELLTAVRPFDRDSQVATLSAILRTEYRPIVERRPEVPRDLVQLVERCLAHDPTKRFASGAELASALRTIVDQRRASKAHAVPPKAGVSPLTLVALATLTVLALSGAVWQWRQSRAVTSARQALTLVEQLASDQEFLPAFTQLKRLMPVLSGDPLFQQLWSRVSMTTTIRTSPPGARLSMRSYRGDDDDWTALGDTPLVGISVPQGHVRFRLELAGYEPLEWTSVVLAPEVSWTLVAQADPRAGMVTVPASTYRIGTSAPVELGSYWIARHEVTNREFKRFVDAGGYDRAEFWTEPFADGAARLSRTDAMARFRDRTGRPGPAGWSLGSYPDGEDDLPVSGVSWYEASAYAAFSRRRLPTIHEWMKAAGLGPSTAFFSDIVAQSNFSGSSAVAVESLGGVSPYGAYDMAGNVKEWCTNPTSIGQRFSLGGAWGEPTYLFRDLDAHSAFERRATFGFRLADSEQPPRLVTLNAVERDLAKARPASDEAYQAYVALYGFIPQPIAAQSLGSDQPLPFMRRERVSYAAAYGGVRIPAWLLLPTNAAPPYQTLVYWPSGESTEVDSSEFVHRDWRLEFVLRSGRAVLHPIYAGTFERRREAAPGAVPGSLTIRRAQDVIRAVDYLAERPDIDRERLGFYGASLGASRAPIFLALERRFKSAVLLWGGLPDPTVAVADPVNFAPRVTVPVLMVNGRHDFIFPVNSSQVPMLELLGTPAVDKRHVLFDYGHIPPKNDETIKEVLDWLDRYLGPVKR